MVNFFKTGAGLENREGFVYMQGHSLAKIAEKYGTPLHVLSAQGLRENYSALQAALEKQEVAFHILYAMKANSHSEVLRILHGLGAGIDAVSVNEVLRAIRAGVPPEKIMFTGSWNSRNELETLLEKKIALNVDSLDDLQELVETTGKGKKFQMPETVSFRVNGEFGAGHSHHVITGGTDSQFGIWQDEIAEAYEKAKNAGAKKFGMHVHIGSGVLEPSEFIKAAKIVLELAGMVRKKCEIEFEFIDFGGGLGVPYKSEQEPLDLNAHFTQLCNLFKQKTKELDLGNPALVIEPGRFLVCDAEVMLGQVRATKSTPEKNFARTNLSFNDLARHAMYGSYHHVFIDGKAGLPENKKYTITGTICETGDRIATDRMLPEIKKGDLIIALNTGAYGYAMGSEYNSRARPPIVLIDEKKETLISRRGTIDDVLRHEVQ